jgi:protein-tyrosine phosphatase
MRRRAERRSALTMPALDSRSAQARVLFVCANNICRSPIAEGVFRVTAQRRGLDRIEVDSAGIFANHAGRPPDPRAIATASARGYDLSGIRARQVIVADFERFAWILAMDEHNLRALASIAPQGYAGHLGLLMSFAEAPPSREVPDPYFGSRSQFDEVVRLVEMACEGLASRLLPARRESAGDGGGGRRAGGLPDR